MQALVRKVMGSLATVTLFSSLLAAQVNSANRFDNSVQQQVTHKLGEKKEFRNVQASVAEGIVTLTGTVDVYQEKLDAAKRVRKADHVGGVRNFIEVAGPAIGDEQLQAKLNEKLWYDRIGYDNVFDYFVVRVKDGIVTFDGETYNDVAHDSALGIVQRMPGVKEVIDNVTASSVSPFDDQVRIRAARAIYGDPTLSRYATIPALPIRIIVNHGHLGLYGVVDSAMDKQIAGMRANQVFGAFTVENHLVVSNPEKIG